jgi:hypothetical protein
MATKPKKLLASASAAVSLKAKSVDVRLLQRGQQLERKGVVGPVLVNDRCDFMLHEHAHRFTTASSSAFSVPASSQKSLFGTVSGFGWAMPACTVDTSVLLHTDARCEGFLGSINLIARLFFGRYLTFLRPPGSQRRGMASPVQRCNRALGYRHF